MTYDVREMVHSPNAQTSYYFLKQNAECPEKHDSSENGINLYSHICDVICEKGPYCGTNIIGTDQTSRMMRGV